MKDIGYSFYDLILTFNLYIGNGLTLPLTNLLFTVDYKNSTKDFAQEIARIQAGFDYYSPKSVFNRT